MKVSAIGCAVLAGALLLTSCQKDEETATKPTHDERAILDVPSELPAVEIHETIDGAQFGLIGDGSTVNTETFRRLMSASHREIRIPAGDYVTGSFSVPSHTILTLEPGTVIRDSGELAKHERVINIRSEHVRIYGSGARVLANRADYVRDEWRHGIYIFGARDVLIEGLESSSHGGDGFYIGGPPGSPSTDVILRACRAENNRRQGLSITSARRVHVVDCEFMDTNGTSPEYGIDLEPNNPIDVLDQIVILRPRTLYNRGGGIMAYLRELDATSEPVDIAIVDHYSDGETPSVRTDTSPERGRIRYNRVY